MPYSSGSQILLLHIVQFWYNRKSIVQKKKLNNRISKILHNLYLLNLKEILYIFLQFMPFLLNSIILMWSMDWFGRLRNDCLKLSKRNFFLKKNSPKNSNCFQSTILKYILNVLVHYLGTTATYRIQYKKPILAF